MTRYKDTYKTVVLPGFDNSPEADKSRHFNWYKDIVSGRFSEALYKAAMIGKFPVKRFPSLLITWRDRADDSSVVLQLGSQLAAYSIAKAPKGRPVVRKDDKGVSVFDSVIDEITDMAESIYYLEGILGDTLDELQMGFRGSREFSKAISHGKQVGNTGGNFTLLMNNQNYLPDTPVLTQCVDSIIQADVVYRAAMKRAEDIQTRILQQRTVNIPQQAVLDAKDGNRPMLPTPSGLLEVLPGRTSHYKMWLDCDPKDPGHQQLKDLFWFTDPKWVVGVLNVSPKVPKPQLPPIPARPGAADLADALNMVYHTRKVCWVGVLRLLGYLGLDILNHTIKGGDSVVLTDLGRVVVKSYTADFDSENKADVDYYEFKALSNMKGVSKYFIRPSKSKKAGDWVLNSFFKGGQQARS